MYNSDTPLHAELPSSRQLLRSTILAAIAALVLLVTVVLPAEYGIDPTGIGRVLGMTPMGAIKQQLAADAAAEAAAAAKAATAATGTAAATPAPVAAAASGAASAAAVASQAVATQPGMAAASPDAWRDEIAFMLAPGEGTEIKLVMEQGAKAHYAWVVEGGAVNFDTHGDARGKSISYEKGRGVAADDGVLEAAFTGNHGWYWRNRGSSEVKLVLRTRGDYSAIKR
jgi:hypothetical protein